MTRIGVVADTHGNIRLLSKAVREMGAVDVLIHLGDFAADIGRISADSKPARTMAVRGNGDYDHSFSDEMSVEIDGRRFFITHGNRYDPYFSFDSMMEKAFMEECDVLLFGHTHVPVNTRRNDILIFNPGHMHPGAREGSYGILEIDSGRIGAEIRTINNIYLKGA